MTPSSASQQHLQALAAKWRVLGMMLVAFARQINLAHKMRAQVGAHKARLLEAALFAALVQLSADITAAAAQEDALNADDRRELSYLETVHALLGVLALMTRQLKADLANAAERWAKLNAQIALAGAQIGQERAYPPNYLDSG